MATEEIPLYDVTAALGADQLAYHLGCYFPDPEDARVAGHALVIAAASLGALPDLRMAVVCNVAGLAGQALVMGASGVDGAWRQADPS